MYYVASNGIKTVVILQDTEATSPRDPDYQENITNMICFHNRHNLGDKHDYTSPNSFAEDMADKYLTQKDVLKALINGEFADFRLGNQKEDGSFVVEAKIGLIPGKERWEQMDWSVNKDTLEVIEGEAIFDVEMDILDNCWPDEIMRACNKYGDVAIMPLFLYDHGGLTMSTSSFVGRAHHAEWDSGQVGYIYLDKATAMKEMAEAADKLTLAMPVLYAETLKIPHDSGIWSLEENMVKQGYAPVRADDIKNIEAPCPNGPANQTIIDPKWAKNGLLFKKDHTLYVFENYNPDNTMSISPVATFNPDLKSLTEETWRARAEEAMVADVKDYDNYLQGEIYGYKLFEGVEEIDSCWGYNPGDKEITDLMNDEHCRWFGGKLEFETEYGYDFDIDKFFEANYFSEIWDDITKKTVTLLHEDFQAKVPFPYGMPFEDIRADKDGVLNDIVQSLYDEHKEVSVEDIRNAIFEHAGVARQLQPKLSAEDLEPGKDYTADELMDLLKKKPSLDALIHAADSKRMEQGSEPHENNRTDLTH